MLYELWNKNNKCLIFDLDDMYMHVSHNQFLPYALKDYVTDTDLSSKESVKKSMHHLNVLRDWLSNRVLNLSRENAKVILNVTQLPQTLKTEDRLKIVLACRAMNMEDNYWLKLEDEDVTFSDIHLRTHSLSEKSYNVAILGEHISATAKELRADLSSTGLFPKYWMRENEDVYMMKTDSVGGYMVEAEVAASKYIMDAGGNALHYTLQTVDGRKFSKSKCIASDSISIVHAQELIDYNNHTGQQFNPSEDFANMVVCDYVLANTDRHSENWAFYVSSDTNNIIKQSMLYDFNQCLIADKFHTDIDDLLYEPTGLSMKESADKFIHLSTVDFDRVALPYECRERWVKIRR